MSKSVEKKYSKSFYFNGKDELHLSFFNKQMQLIV